MARGWNYHHDGNSDIAEYDGVLKIDVQSSDTGSGAPAGAIAIDNTANSARGLNVYSNSSSTDRELIRFHLDNTSADEEVLQIDNDGTGEGIFINQDGDGIALNIDSEASTSAGIEMDCAINNGYNSLLIKHGGANKFIINRNTNVNAEVAMKLGNYWLWVDSTGDLRIHSSVPTGDTSGSVVGTQS